MNARTERNANPATAPAELHSDVDELFMILYSLDSAPRAPLRPARFFHLLARC